MTLELADAARVIVASLRRLELSTPALLLLLDALDAAQDKQSAKAIRTAVVGVVDKQWEEYLPRLREAAIERLHRQQSQWDHDFREFLGLWPRLRSDAELRARSVDVLASDLARVGERLRSLRHLDGDLASARRILCACMANGAGSVDPDELALLLVAWAGHTAWGQVQYRLWWIGARASYGSPVSDIPDIPAAVTEAVQHVRQLRLIV